MSIIILDVHWTKGYAKANLHILRNYATIIYFIFMDIISVMLSGWQSGPINHFAKVNFSKILLVLGITFWMPALGLIHSQSVKDQIEIGDDGIMRWQTDGKEVTGFGFNYTVPFAHAYRMAKKSGIDLKKTIDQDVYQFARLGLDLFRVHVWDCEISDTLGNLIDNEHLELLDYLLHRLEDHHINAIITPIAYWGNGWPDEDEPTPGFSSKYGKANCLTDPGAIKAQENYLRQFVNHINRFSGVSYKSYKTILAIEICNEPHHRGTPQEVTSFVKKLKEAVRSTGCTKPVFYNVTHGINLAASYYAAGIDGGTFQWYPTGLGFQKELGGNMLPNVDRYTIPFDDVLKKNASARIVYEFDAADMASTYMYPAMARSFRTAGMQLATHFSYDPTFLAPYNTEYNTHYMNLIYAPRKALSLMICGEIFRSIPLYKDYGVYPDNASFGPFRVNYENDLAEMVTDEKFIYTNHTSTLPSNPDKLKLIAGWGNSPLVAYDGTGAYFLDKIAEGAWRVEIMPDAIVVGNLFGRNSLDKTVAVIKYDPHKLKFNMPGFENGFTLARVANPDSIMYSESTNKSVALKPGVYLLLSSSYQKKVPFSFQSKLTWDERLTLPAGSTKSYEPYTSARTRKTNDAGDAISLFDAGLDDQWLNRNWIPESGAKKDIHTGNKYFSLSLPGLTSIDEENPNAPLIADYSIRHYFGDLIANRKNEVLQKKTLVVNASAVSNTTFPMQVALVMKDGSAFGGSIQLDSTHTRYELKLDELQKVQAVILPRPYPTFLPYYSVAGKEEILDLSQIESLQISIGPGIKKEDYGNTYAFKLVSVLLE